MAGLDSARRTLWRNALDANAHNATVAESLVSHVEGEIKFGAVLKYNRLSAISTREYIPGTDITIDTLETTPTDLEIDQRRYFAVKLDITDAESIPLPLLASATAEGGLALAEERDRVVFAAMIAGADSANEVGTALSPYDLSTTGQTVRRFVGSLVKNLVVAKAGRSGLFLVGGPDFTLEASNDASIVQATAAGDAAIAAGYVGRIAGVDYYESNDSALAGVVIVGSRKATGFAATIEDVRISEMEKQFATLVKGLNVYGLEVIVPEYLAVGTFAPAV